LNHHDRLSISEKLSVTMEASPLTLCLLNYEYPPIGAGAASATREMAESITRMGHRVIVVAAGIGELVGERLEEGVRTIRLPCRRTRHDRASLREMLSFVMAARQRLPTIVRDHECDGIICFFTLPCGPAAWRAWKKTQVPYAVSLRGGDVPGLVPSIDWIHRVLTPLRRAILRNALAIVANSEGLQHLSHTHDPFPVRVIPNGVNTKRFRPQNPPRADDVFRVLAVGRLQEQKNHAFALHVLASVQRRVTRRLEYHVVGDGPLRHELESLARQLHLDDAIIWHGWVPREQLAEIYRSSDCLLHPTLYEGMPNAVLEAMAAGLPVVASAVPGNCDLVVDGRTGYICALGDRARFAESLIKLAGDSALSQSFGHAARRVVEADYSWEAVSRRYVEIFRQNRSMAGAAALERGSCDKSFG
jgi:glycosyltransferase involved in cell wall biosynthesis